MVHELYDKPEKGITASAFDFICFFPVWLHFPSHVLYFNFKARLKIYEPKNLLDRRRKDYNILSEVWKVQLYFLDDA